jgi:signal transduction histidine kinase/HPt (histidine-containing phosphotransfer) domain-containing protein/ActR/RegA family two-component response regulator
MAAPGPDTPSPPSAASIDLELQRQLLPLLGRTAWAVDATWLAVLAVIWSADRQPWCWLLLAGYAATAVPRHVFHRMYARRLPVAARLPRWTRTYCALSVPLGLGWGGLVVLARLGGTSVDLILPAVMVAGAALNAAVIRARHLPVAIAFVAPSLAVSGAAMVPNAEFALRAIGVGHALYLVALVALVHHLGCGHRQRLVLEIEHRDALQRFDDARRGAEAANLRLSTVLDNLSDGVILYEADGRWSYANPAIMALHRVTPDVMHTLPHMRQVLRYFLERGEWGEVVDVDAEIGRLEANIRGTHGRSHTRRTLNGRVVEIRFVQLPGGATLGINRDITEFEEQNASLQRTIAALENARATAEAARTEAEAANQAKSTFLAVMSHEIRTPMNGVLGSAELLAREALNDRQRRLVSTVQVSAAALLRIIDDVLDFSKIEAGRMELEQAPFALRGLVDSTVETLSVQAARSGLQLTGAVEPDAPDMLIGDAARLRQILLNLIGNAIKFTEQGTVNVAARVAPSGDGKAALSLTVADTGIGMTAEQLARLFQPFAQADSSTTRRFGGTGLGLSIVRRLAQLMSGDVSVHSKPGEGSTFTVEVLVGLGQTATEHETPNVVATAQLPPGRVRVLVVDDYPVNLEVLSDQLGILGVAADTARDGIEALTKWRASRHAIVLTDIHMPDMDGYSLARQIRTEEAADATRTTIVALTANALKGEEDRCRAAGMDEFLTKPLTLARLHQALARWWAPRGGDRPQIDPAGGETDAEAAPALDRGAISQFFGDNPAIVGRLLSRFRDSGQALVGTIEAEATAERLALLAEAAHKLRGAARTAGATRLADLAGVLEQGARNGQATEAKELAQAVRTEWSRVAAELAHQPTSA